MSAAWLRLRFSVVLALALGACGAPEHAVAAGAAPRPTQLRFRSIDRVVPGPGGALLSVEGTLLRLHGSLLERVEHCEPPEGSLPEWPPERAGPRWLDRTHAAIAPGDGLVCDLSDRAVEPVFQVAGPAPRERSALPASTAIGFVLAREGSRLLARGPTERFALEIGRRFDARPTTPPSHVVALVCPDRTVVLADLRERSLTPLELPREHWTAFFVANGRVVAQRGGEAVATELDGAQRQEGPARMRASGPAAGALSQDGSLFAMVDHLFVRVFDPRRSSLSSWFQTGGDVRERPEVPARVRFADGGRSLLVLWPDRAARFSVLGSDIVERHEPTATVVRASPDGSRVALCVPTRPRQPDRLVLSTLRRIRRDRFGTRRTVELGDGACSDPQLVWMSPHVIWVVWGGLDVVAADSDVAERRAVISLHSHGGQLVVREGDAAIAQLEDAPRARARLAGSALRWHQLGDTRAICDRPVRRPPLP